MTLLVRTATALTCALLLSVVSSPATAQDAFLVQYDGELFDENVQPIGGIFDFTFRLYESLDAETAIWEERNYVSVHGGEYTVLLGSNREIDRSWNGRDLFIAIDFGGNETGRTEQTIVRWEPPPEIFEELVPVEIVIAGHRGEVTEVTFADVANRALMADEAREATNCQTLEGRRLAEIEDRIDRIMESLGEHSADPNAHGGGTSPRLGRSQTVLPAAGGPGGTRYTRTCPNNYVAVGVRGGAGQLLDSIEIVCAPLE